MLSGTTAFCANNAPKDQKPAAAAQEKKAEPAKTAPAPALTPKTETYTISGAQVPELSTNARAKELRNDLAALKYAIDAHQ